MELASASPEIVTLPEMLVTVTAPAAAALPDQAAARTIDSANDAKEFLITSSCPERRVAVGARDGRSLGGSGSGSPHRVYTLRSHRAARGRAGDAAGQRQRTRGGFGHSFRAFTAMRGLDEASR